MKNEPSTWAVYRSAFDEYDAFPDLGKTAHLRGRILSERVESCLTRTQAEETARARREQSKTNHRVI